MRKTVLVGISSGIAAYKTLELIKLLRNEGIEVFVVMTENTTKMVSSEEFEKASGNKVFIDLFNKEFDYKKILKIRKVDHIELADKAGVMVIAPATANIIAKLAHGIADNVLTTTALAVTAPIFVCPSMNVNMWNNPAVVENISRLRALGYLIIEPTEGMLACGYTGKGRLENVEVIKDEILRQLKRSQSLKGKKIIITAGGTKEKIDDIRYITNRSSGKMGVAIAEECYLRGGSVLLLRANSSVKPRFAIPEETFDTADDLMLLIKKNIFHSDIVFHVAAVSDFKIQSNIKGKISSEKNFQINLKPRKKIIDQIKKLNSKTYLVAFKAEFGRNENDLINVLHKKLLKSQADLIIANDVSKADRGFAVDTNEVFIVFKNGAHVKIPLATKREIASRIVEFVNTQLSI